MRAGVPDIVLGVVLLGAGVGLTLVSEGKALFWGAIAAGVIELIVGIVKALRSSA